MTRLDTVREGVGKGRWKRVIVQAVVLCVVPAVVAVVVNQRREGGIPLVAETDYTDDILVPCPENLIDAYPVELADLPEDFAGITVVDARPRGDYLAGHLPGALNIPLRPVMADHDVYRVALAADLAPLLEVAPILQLPKLPIVVCGDERLRSGRNMASVLLENGFRDVRYLEGGCDVWLQFGWSFDGVQDEVVAVAPDDVAPDLAGYTVVDARFGRYYRRGHLPGAVSIPYMMVEGGDDIRLDPIRENMAGPILVYGDATRGEGQDLARVLADAGWTAVHYLEGGFEAWEAAGLPMETPSPHDGGGQ